METLSVFLYGILGGSLAELSGLFRLKHQGETQFPKWIRSAFYWVVTVLMIAAGGGLAIAYATSGFEIKPLVAVNIGASAPLIISRFAAEIPQVGKID